MTSQSGMDASLGRRIDPGMFMKVVGVWVGTFLGVRVSVPDLVAVDSNTSAIVAATLSFLGAIIVALINNSRRTRSDATAREVLEAVLEKERLEGQILDLKAEVAELRDAHPSRRRRPPTGGPS